MSNVIQFFPYKAARFKAQLRKQFIVEFKNKLLRLYPEQFIATKGNVAKKLQGEPGNAKTQVLWELLMEVEQNG